MRKPLAAAAAGIRRFVPAATRREYGHAVRQVARRDPTLEPLAISGPGRSGTTFLMELIGTSPNVLFERVSEYERRYFAYLWRMSRLLAPADSEQRGWRSVDIVRQPWQGAVAPVPFTTQWFDQDALAERAFVRLWREMAATMLAQHDCACGGTRHVYLEKIPLAMVMQMRHAMPVRAIHIVRDPRDVFLSQLAFARKRNKPLFGLSPQRPVSEVAEEFAEGQSKRLKRLQRLKRETDLVIRFEDLMSEPETTTASIAAWCGLKLDVSQATIRTSRYEDHRTSARPQGRWRAEMGSELRECFHKAMAAELDYFDYETE